MKSGAEAGAKKTLLALDRPNSKRVPRPPLLSPES